MSKVSDFIAAYRKQQEPTDQTVAEYAMELSKPLDSFMQQLSEAGIKKSSRDEILTHEDKNQLLKHLQKAHRPRGRRMDRTITIDHEINKFLRTVAAQENGAEWELLERFAAEVVWGQPIEPALQNVANLVCAKAVLTGALPLRRRGRPESDEIKELGLKVAQEYWFMRDSGHSYQETVNQLALRHHKDERHLMRMVEKHKSEVGLTLEDRQRHRRWVQTMQEIYSSSEAYEAHLAPIFREQMPVPDFSWEDYIEHLDEMIRAHVDTLKPLTKKI
jgi:chorismate mutase